jgi:hypothetical protein
MAAVSPPGPPHGQRNRAGAPAPVGRPRVTWPGSAPWRTAARSGLWRPLGPTSRATSSASMAWSTCRPVPTARASSPSRGGVGQFGHGDGHSLGQVQLRVVDRGGALGILRHGGPLLVERLGGCPTPTTRQVTGRGPPPQLLQEPGQPRWTRRQGGPGPRQSAGMTGSRARDPKQCPDSGGVAA